MPVQILEEDASSLDAYGEVLIAFRVTRRFRIIEGEGTEARLVEEMVAPPWVKDYDQDGGPPSRLAERWDLSAWGVLAAFDDRRRIGGALVAWQTPGMDMLEGRDDLAVLWDLRVHPDCRRRGVGSHLLGRALAWAESRGCTRLDVETQDINVPACRFYQLHDFRLRSIERSAYVGLPDEVKLVWSLGISPNAA